MQPRYQESKAEAKDQNRRGEAELCAGSNQGQFAVVSNLHDHAELPADVSCDTGGADNVRVAF